MKNILITGSSEGIGLETAKILAEQGNSITLVSRSKEKLEKVMKELHGENHQYIIADLTKSDDINAIKNKIETNHYDVLINNAGAGLYGKFHELSLDEQLKIIQLNISAVTMISHFYLSQAKKGDALINVSSMLSDTSMPGAAVYAATKGYIKNLSESLWWEYKKEGIYVAGFSPGLTYTNFHNASGGDKNNYQNIITQKPQHVAMSLVKALKRRKHPTTFSGIMNRFLILLPRGMNRKWVIHLMGINSPMHELNDE